MGNRKSGRMLTLEATSAFGKKRLYERPFAIGHVACIVKAVSSILRTGDLSPAYRKLHRSVSDRRNLYSLGSLKSF